VNEAMTADNAYPFHLYYWAIGGRIFFGPRIVSAIRSVFTLHTHLPFDNDGSTPDALAGWVAMAMAKRGGWTGITMRRWGCRRVVRWRCQVRDGGCQGVVAAAITGHRRRLGGGGERVIDSGVRGGVQLEVEGEVAGER
jgi:hypothetical protein